MGKQAARPPPKKSAKKAQKKKAVAPKKKAVKKTPPKKVTKKPLPVKAAVKSKPAPAPKKVAKAPKPAKAPAGPKGYTASEYEKFKEHVKKFNGKTNQYLKDLLRKNLQSMSGSKDELVYKCADGATLGRIPRCTSCFGGRYFS